jgi:2-polyprenyl-3-methyl-5-hydroxy-6-metoxy-1,4-benzoquinol methylase
MFKVIKNIDFGYFEIFPKPTEQEIEKFYQQDFYAEDYKYFNDSSIDVQIKDLNYLRRWWKLELKQLDNFCGTNGRALSIFDIGCGWCQFLLYAKSEGHQVKGYDPSPEAALYGKDRGLDVITGNFKNFSEYAHEYDVVVLKNVLEHVVDPIHFINDISDHFLRAGSIIQIEVPNEFSLLQKLAKDKHSLNEWWVAPPAHLNYFNLPAMKKIFNHLNLEIIDAYGSFPMELFLLMGRDYISDPELGRAAHSDRVEFEMSFLTKGKSAELLDLYRRLIMGNVGRQVTIIGRKL